MVLVLSFELIESVGKRLVRCEQFTQSYKGANHVHPHLDRPRAIQNVGRLNGAVFGEGKRSISSATASVLLDGI